MHFKKTGNVNSQERNDMLQGLWERNSQNGDKSIRGQHKNDVFWDF